MKRLLERGLLKRIHVNQHHVRANKKDGGERPVFTVKTYKENVTCHHVDVKGGVTLVNRPEKPLACGATVWIETRDEVECIV